ncbi:hypothetical protein COMNV_01144 [Commensalibacter sp. Nvir]|uniref:hypothetical protein n=1 Tax=Commensalibacter sp. Nvir TaxID=3069817 RepID=UPI002D661724|nr:hypothetical protein COMNV_01144 [Commensalibacter sp. Nvir]
MRKFIFLASMVGVSIMLFACGHKTEKPLRDDPYDRTMDVAKDAVYYNRLKQAEVNYTKAFDLALGHDDRNSINNSGYNLATVQLALNKIDDAESTLYKTRQELYIRGQNDSKQLDLLQGVCLYKKGLYQKAIAFIKLASTSEDQDIKQRSVFLMGFLSYQLQDISTLQYCINQLEADKTTQDKNNLSAKADVTELKSLYSLSVGDYQKALSQAQQVEAVRRQQKDYRAMLRDLLLQAKIYLTLHQSQEAARCYLRAGETAKHMSNTGLAEFYFNQALLYSESYTMNQFARTKLQDLQKSKSVQ